MHLWLQVIPTAASICFTGEETEARGHKATLWGNPANTGPGSQSMQFVICDVCLQSGLFSSRVACPLLGLYEWDLHSLLDHLSVRPSDHPGSGALVRSCDPLVTYFCEMVEPSSLLTFPGSPYQSAGRGFPSSGVLTTGCSEKPLQNKTLHTWWLRERVQGRLWKGLSRLR